MNEPDDHLLRDVQQMTSPTTGGTMWRCDCTCGYRSPLTPRPGAAFRHARAHQSARTATVSVMHLAPALPGSPSTALPTLVHAQAEINRLQALLNGASADRNRIAREPADARDEHTTAAEERDEHRRARDVATANADGLAYQLGEITRIACEREDAEWTDAISAIRRLRAVALRVQPLLDAITAWRYLEPAQRSDDGLADAFDDWTMQ